MGEQVLDHPATLGPVGYDKRVDDNDETSRLERVENGLVQLTLLGMGGDMVEGKRGDDGVGTGAGVRNRACRS